MQLEVCKNPEHTMHTLYSTITGTEIMSVFYKASSRVMESLTIIDRVVKI